MKKLKEQRRLMVSQDSSPTTIRAVTIELLQVRDIPYCQVVSTILLSNKCIVSYTVHIPFLRRQQISRATEQDLTLQVHTLVK